MKNKELVLAKGAKKQDSLIRPWARKSALSLINALSSEQVTRLPKPVGQKYKNMKNKYTNHKASLKYLLQDLKEEYKQYKTEIKTSIKEEDWIQCEHLKHVNDSLDLSISIIKDFLNGAFNRDGKFDPEDMRYALTEIDEQIQLHNMDKKEFIKHSEFLYIPEMESKIQSLEYVRDRFKAVMEHI